MKIKAIDCSLIKLPFRFAFKHSLASRSFSENAIVRVHALSSSGQAVTGYGESVPRDYVTGESPAGVVRTIGDVYAPRFGNGQYERISDLTAGILAVRKELGLDSTSTGASFCALELALLDAFGKCSDRPLVDLLNEDSAADNKGSRELASLPSRIRYGGVIPFGGKNALTVVLWFYKAYGFKTVKIKVGKGVDEDVAKLTYARRLLGPDVTLRVDANCAWDRDTTERFARAASCLNIASIEQPVPADRLEDMAYLTKNLPMQIMADESLCSVSQAENLARTGACSAFNIRISKVGGLLAARQIARIGRAADINCHMGAQVGESGILSAAGRVFAALEQPLDNCEGSNNFFLIKSDITRENLNVAPGGWGAVYRTPGLGVTVDERKLSQMSVSRDSAPATQSREVLERA